ncbi:hypothetical protein Hanom_Chr10g00953001 [Helianthus anomalus]
MKTPAANPAKVFMEKEIITETINEDFNVQVNGGVTEEDGSVENMEGGSGEVNAVNPLIAEIPVKNNKRKKDKKKQVDLGLGSGGSYLSSNDRPNKRPKTDDDPFELEPIIRGVDCSG